MAKTKEEKNQELADRLEAEQKERVALKREQATAPDGKKRLVAMPFGRQVDLNEFVLPGFDYQDNKHLVDPGSALKNPRKGAEYRWPIKDDPKTEAFIRQQLYRVVNKDELREDHGLEIVTHKGTDDGVYWYKHVLVEVPPEVVKKFNSQAFRNAELLSRQEESFKGNVEQVSGGKAVGTIKSHIGPSDEDE